MAITKTQFESYYPTGWRPDEHFLLSDMFIRVKSKKQVGDRVITETKSRFVGRTMPYWDHPQPCDCKNCVHTHNCKQCYRTYHYVMRTQHWMFCVGADKKAQFLQQAKGDEKRAMVLAHNAGRKYVETMDKIHRTNWRKGFGAWLCPCFRKSDAPTAMTGIDWDDILTFKTKDDDVRYVDTARSVQIEL